MGDELKGREPTIVIVDDFALIRAIGRLERLTAEARQKAQEIIIIDNEAGLLEGEFGFIDTFKFIRQSRLPDITMCIPEWTTSVLGDPTHNWKYMEGKVLPKPVKPINKQAPRQSFRQSMRSVNRNR